MSKNQALLLTLVALFLSSSSIMFGQSNKETIKHQLSQTKKYYNLSENDVAEWTVTAQHRSKRSGLTHVYLRQMINGLEINQAVADLHFNDAGDLFSHHSSFISDIAKKVRGTSPGLTAIQAVQAAAAELGLGSVDPLMILENKNNTAQEVLLTNGGISVNDIPARLMYQPVGDDLILAWDLVIYELDKRNWWSLRLDASTGKILHKDNWVTSCNFGEAHNHDHSCSASHAQEEETVTEADKYLMVGAYRVYPIPIESPNHGGRSLVNDPDDPIASPFGWHDTNGAAGAEFTITRGNNCHAYEDGDNPGFSPNGGAGLTFDYPINTTYSNANQSESAALTNLFYWTNVTHDIWYQYGFDEASGNFQENNYGNGGAGGDSVNSEAQDGSGTCNANFGTPTDGGNPTMQMYVCGSRDGDLDNVVIAHEYGHGISIRLTGGGGNSGCLNNTEQMGEGWSDWFGLMMTIEPGDAGTDGRGVGTWLVGEGANGPGIRTHQYSTDMGINPHTYDDINTEVAPHGVGSVWCAMIWDLAWALIDDPGFAYGFDSDFYYGTGGNNVAMALVTEGLKLQPCSPGFVDGRDAILAADQALYGGIHQCLIWEVFARRGLGFSATQGSSGSKTDGTEAFDMPPTCSIQVQKTADVTEVSPGGTITYSIQITNTTGGNLNNVSVTDPVPTYTTYVNGSASNGGSEAGGVVSWPTFNMTAGQVITLTFQVVVDAGAPSGTFSFSDDMESGGGNWTATSTNAGTGNWVLNGSNPFSGANNWFAQDFNTPVDMHLDLASGVALTATSTLSFMHSYDTEATWDGGQVLISTNGGVTWTDLGPQMTANGYNSTIDNNAGSPAFSGNSGGYIQTDVDLSSYAGQLATIRFRMHCDASVGGNGWYIDDVTIGDLVTKIPNTATVTAGSLTSTGSLPNPTCIIPPTVPEINFVSAASSFTEGSAVGGTVDCRDYTDVNIPLNIGAAPTGDANVTVSVTGGTATNTVDYDILTPNLVFAAPGNQNATIRIYDDASVEGPETIDLTFTITNTGSTDAYAGAVINHTLTINDDDNPPVGSSTTSVTYLNEDFNGTATGWTANDNSGNTTDNWTLATANGGLDGSQYALSDSDAAGNGSDTNEELFSPVFDASNATTLTLDFDQYFREYGPGFLETIDVDVWDGSAWQNVFNHDGSGGALGAWGAPNHQTIDILAHANAAMQLRFTYIAQWDYWWALDNVVVTGTEITGAAIETVITSSDEQYLGPFDDVYFYNTDGDIMVRIVNNTGHDYGCTTVEVQHDGTAASGVSANNGAEDLTDKAYKVTPTNNNPAGDYDITLYYTAAEINGWQASAANGDSDPITDLKMFKGASDVRTDATVEEATPTAGTAPNFPTGTPTDFAVTANYTTGFSSFAVGSPGAAIMVETKVFLQGPLAGTLMNDDLRAGGYIPTAEPYSGLGFARVGGGGETTTAAVLATTGNDAIVDWVLVELRDGADPTTVLANQAALVQRDGDVVSASDGTSAVFFTGFAPGNYYISVNHRNHLGACTGGAVALDRISTGVKDFTTMVDASSWGTHSQKDMGGGVFALWAGDGNIDSKVKYTGTGNDPNTTLTNVLTFPANTAFQYNYDFALGYFQGDFDLNGKVKYAGTGDDPNLVLVNVLTYPTNSAFQYNYDFVIEQLP